MRLLLSLLILALSTPAFTDDNPVFGANGIVICDYPIGMVYGEPKPGVITHCLDAGEPLDFETFVRTQAKKPYATLLAISYKNNKVYLYFK